MSWQEDPWFAPTSTLAHPPPKFALPVYKPSLNGVLDTKRGETVSQALLSGVLWTGRANLRDENVNLPVENNRESFYQRVQ